MCDPLSATILAVASTAATIYSANRAADAQEAAIRDQLSMLEAESVTTETADVNEHLRAMRKEQARIRVAAGEAGLQLGSGSIETLLKDSMMQTSLAASNTRLNAERDRRAARAEANRGLSGIQKDTFLGAGLKLASAGVSGWSQGSSLQISRERAAAQAGRS